MTTQYDVIIVGAGPAGSSCAFNLKRMHPGARVLLLDKAVFPRDKTCGGGISPEVANYLDFDLTDAINDRCTAFEMVANGKRVTSQNGEVLMVRRAVFDDFLLNKAIEAGVETMTGCQVTDIESMQAHPLVKTSAGDFSAHVVVIAEGGRGKLARKLGIAPDNKVFAGLEYEHYVEKTDDTLHINFDYDDCGYAWNFPKADGLSLGIGGLVKGKQKDGTGLPGKLKQFIKQFNVDTPDKKHMHGHPIQLYSGRKKLVHGSIMLAGEIAGCVDPLTAEGIRPAIKNGYLVATVLAKALKSGKWQVIKQYDGLFHREIGKDFRYARILSWFAIKYRNAVLPYLTTTAGIDCFMSVFGGQSSYRAQMSKKRVFRLMSKSGSYTLRRLLGR